MLIAIAYAALLFAYRWGWRTMPEAQLPKDFEPQTHITVLIPARNEAANIEACLRSILNGKYPPNLLKIIVINDFSEDKTIEIVQQLSESWELSGSCIRCIRLAEHLPPEARFTPNKKRPLHSA